MLSMIVVVSIAIIIPMAILILSDFLGGRKFNKAKFESYESGLEKVEGGARDRFSVKFYLIAIMFILFDVEAVFMFPWAVNFRALGMTGFIEMTLFIIILLAGFVYIVKKGALEWD